MPVVPIRGLGRAGILPDTNAFDIPPNAFAEGRNVRIESGRVASTTGWILKEGDTGSPLRHAASLFTEDGNCYAVVRDNGITLFTDSGAGADVTPAGGMTASTEWHATQMGDKLVLTAVNQPPLFLDNNGGAAAELPSWPATLRAKRIFSYQGFLVAIGIVKAATEVPYLIKWSDPVEPGTMFASWDETDPTTLAGENPLVSQGGALIDAGPLRDALVVYAEHEVHAMQLVGGTYVFAFRTLFDDDGIINPDAFASFKGKHLVVGNHSIYMHDGIQKTPVADERVEAYFFTNMRNSDSVFCFNYKRRNEVWVCFSTKDASAYADQALIYNYQYDVWTLMDLPVDASGVGLVDHITLAPRFSGTTVKWSDYTTSWRNQSDQWVNLQPTDDGRYPLLISESTSELYEGDNGYTAAGANILARLSQPKLDLDEIFKGNNTLKRVKSLYPQISGSGSVDIRAGGSNTPLGSVSWGPWRPFNLEADHKVDVFETYRYLALELRKPADGFFEVSGWDIEVDEKHAR